MKPYDNLIKDIEQVFLSDYDDNSSKGLNPLRSAESSLLLPNARPNEILLKSDTAFELGANPLPCVSTLAISFERVFDNRTYLKGLDLPQIKSDVSFGKAIFIQVSEFDDEQELFNAVKELEAVRFKYVPSGFMVRASAINMREQIRVSKIAAIAKYSFADYGRFLTEKFLSYAFVKSCSIYFATDYITVKKLQPPALKIHQTTAALNHILENVLVNCDSCNFRKICERNDGFKELHINLNKRGK